MLQPGLGKEEANCSVCLGKDVGELLGEEVVMGGSGLGISEEVTAALSGCARTGACSGGTVGGGKDDVLCHAEPIKL